MRGLAIALPQGPFIVFSSTAIFALAVFVLPCPADDSAAKGAGKSESPIQKQPAPPAKTAAAKQAAAPKKPMTAQEREAAAIAFAREHHPELAALVEKLRTENRREFDKAIRDLTTTRDRLVRLEKISHPQFELALKAWKLDSRANLLAARMTVSNDPALEDELKKILRERVDVRLEELQAERGRLEDRLGKVRSMIQTIEADRGAAAVRDVERVKRTVVKNRRPLSKKPATPSAQPAAKPVIAERPQQKLPQTPEQVSQPAPVAKLNAE